MSDQWYYAKGNEKLGPVSESQLRELAETGKLLPTDKVWQKGMTEWQDARTVAVLFPTDGPPPLSSDGSGGAGRLKELVWNYICQLWPNKLRFFSMCLLMSGVLTLLVMGLALLLFAIDNDSGIVRLVVLILFLFVLSDIALLVVVLDFAAKGSRRRTMLCDPRRGFSGSGNKHWEPTHKSTPSLLFFEDGGMMRSDGFGAKWKYDLPSDAIVITTLGSVSDVALPIISLTSDELVLSIEGRALHYKKGTTLTGERLAQLRAKQAEFAKNAAIVAASAVAVVGIAAVGALAAVGAAGAAAGAAGAGGGGGGPVSGGIGPVSGASSAPSKTSAFPGTTPVKCASCSGKGWYNPGERNERRCPNCGGQGIRYI